MTFYHQNKRVFRLLAHLLALLIACAPLSSVASALDLSHADMDKVAMQTMDMPGMDHCEQMADQKTGETAAAPACTHCEDQGQCSNPAHSCGHVSSILLQNDVIPTTLHPIAYNPAYLEYLPTVAPEAAFRPPRNL